MTPTERERINEQISGWFEPKPDIMVRSVELHEAADQGLCISRGWSWLSAKEFWRAHEKDWIPSLDFFTDESANARLLDHLIEAKHHIAFIGQMKGGVLMWIDSAHRFLGERKEIIVLAFCKFAGIEVKG